MNPDQLKHWIKSHLTTHPTYVHLEEHRWGPVAAYYRKLEPDSWQRDEFNMVICQMFLEAEDGGWDVEPFHFLCELVDALVMPQILLVLLAIVERRNLLLHPDGANLHMLALRTLQPFIMMAPEGFWLSQPEEVRSRWPGLIHIGVQASRGRQGIQVIKESWALDLEAAKTNR